MKKTYSIIFSLIVSASLMAQQDSYQWRVGVHGGVMSYYGDLSNSYFDAQHPFLQPMDNLDYLSYALSLENNFSKTFSWKLQASQGQFQAYDRSIDFEGNNTFNSNQIRGLNVQTDITNLAFTFNFYTDNDWLLSQKAWIAPYFSIGAGISRFTPYADLFLENGDRYYYWYDGSIRDDMPTNVNANVIDQDFIFETNLARLQTEQVDYNTTTLSFPVGVGLKFRLGDRINLNTEVIGQYTLTDYLDDVSGIYPNNYDNPLQAYASLPGISPWANRGSESKLNDIFGMVGISLHYSFGYKMESFLPPTLYTIGAVEERTINNTLSANDEKAIEKETIIIQIDTSSLIVKEEEVENDSLIQTDINVFTYPDSIKIDTDTITAEEIIEIPQNPPTEKFLDEEIKKLKKALNAKGIEVIYLDGNPILITESDRGLQVIPNDDDTTVTTTDIGIFEAIKSKVDSIAAKPFEISKQELDLSDIDLSQDNETPLELPLNSKQQDTELLLGIEETRSAVLKLTTEFNQLIIERKADKAEIKAMNDKLDILAKMLNDAQQFNNNVAARTNDDFNDTKKMEIRNATNELQKELETIRLQLDRSNSDYAKAIDYANQAQNANEKKILDLDRKRSLLEAELKIEREKRKNAERKAIENNSIEPKVWNPSRTDNSSEKNSTSKIDTLARIDTIYIGSIASEEVIEEQTKDLSAVLDSLVAQIEADKAKEMAAKEKEFNDLKEKLAAVELSLKAAQDAEKAAKLEEENAAMKALEAKIDHLTSKISALEKAEPKVITIEKAIEAKPAEVKVTEVTRSEQLANALKGYQISNVYFKVGKSTVDREFQHRLETLSSLMVLYPELRAIITGYADKSGNAQANLKLSRQRSEAVQSFLLQQGIRQDRVEVNSLGATKASQANDPLSRRVEIVLIY
jgi:outer membrane protein OmpA-like peptidoglycan-associated protein